MAAPASPGLAVQWRAALPPQDARRAPDLRDFPDPSPPSTLCFPVRKAAAAFLGPFSDFSALARNLPMTSSLAPSIERRMSSRADCSAAGPASTADMAPRTLTTRPAGQPSRARTGIVDYARDRSRCRLRHHHRDRIGTCKFTSAFATNNLNSRPSIGRESVRVSTCEKPSSIFWLEARSLTRPVDQKKRTPLVSFVRRATMP